MPCTRRALLMAWACTAAGRAQAQGYPSGPIRLIVPYPPAGASDVVARLMADRIGSTTGWSFVIDNRPGAGGNIGLDALAKARTDGYTLAIGQTANLAINPALYPKMPYDATRDFTPIALVASQPVVLVVRTESPSRTLADLVAAGKARPGALSMASAGNGTVGHLAGELLARRVGLKMIHVPYKGAAPALSDLMGGQTDFMLPTPQAALPLIKGGKLRALVVTSAQRLPVMGEVPTVAESGFTGFEAVDWKMLVGPAGLPADVVKRLHDEVERALAKPDTIATLLAEGSAPMNGSAAEVARFLRAEQARWGQVVREAGIRLE